MPEGSESKKTWTNGKKEVDFSLALCYSINIIRNCFKRPHSESRAKQDSTGQKKSKGLQAGRNLTSVSPKKIQQNQEVRQKNGKNEGGPEKANNNNDLGGRTDLATPLLIHYINFGG